MAKRKAAEAIEEEDGKTPRKTRRTAQEDVSSPKPAETPSGRTSLLTGTPSKPNGTVSAEATPRSLRKVLFSTPVKAGEEVGDEDQAPTATRNDRSARRKSQRTLQKPIVTQDDSEAKDVEADEAVAQKILAEDDVSSEDEGDEIAVAEPSAAPDTPSKSAGKLKGGRRKKSERTPSPPPDLPPHEQYFFQNRAGGNKTSANTLPSGLLLNHEDYYHRITAYKDPHAKDVERLQRYHERAFEQWGFELEEGFSLCLYGYGSKRELVMEFVEDFYACPETAKPKVVIANGYTPGTGLKEILNALSKVVLPKDANVPASPLAMLDQLLRTLSDDPTTRILLVIHSLDHVNLRAKPIIQSSIATLAAHPSISLVATVDTPTFPLLWDSSLVSRFRFLFHNATTFRPYRVELDAVEELSVLLGRSGRRLGGKDGVAYVLRSLPENARSLFRILVVEQLARMNSEPTADSLDLGEDMPDYSDVEAETPSRRGRGRADKARTAKVPRIPQQQAEGVEYRTLYHKAVEEFVCSSELSFRTLLKEFQDHAMVESRRDAQGTERLVVPMAKGELEELLLGEDVE